MASARFALTSRQVIAYGGVSLDIDLTDEQAIRAVRLFYDFSTPDLWENKQKPSPEFVKMVAAALVKQAPADMRPVAEALAADQPIQLTARAEVCRLLLSRLHDSPEFQPVVDRAIDDAKRPHMAIDPITGGFILAMLIATARNSRGLSRVIMALNLPGLLHELPPVLKALPEGVLNAFLRGKATGA